MMKNKYMEIKNIEDAKKYIGKVLYCPDIRENIIISIYIGGVNLFYNTVNYTVEGFYGFSDKKYTKVWGDIEKEQIKNKFDKDSGSMVYSFSKELAKQYLTYLKDQDKNYEVNHAKETLDKHNIKYEIFN